MCVSYSLLFFPLPIRLFSHTHTHIQTMAGFMRGAPHWFPHTTDAWLRLGTMIDAASCIVLCAVANDLQTSTTALAASSAPATTTTSSTSSSSSFQHRRTPLFSFRVFESSGGSSSDDADAHGAAGGRAVVSQSQPTCALIVSRALLATRKSTLLRDYMAVVGAGAVDVGDDAYSLTPVLAALLSYVAGRTYIETRAISKGSDRGEVWRV